MLTYMTCGPDMGYLFSKFECFRVNGRHSSDRRMRNAASYRRELRNMMMFDFILVLRKLLNLSLNFFLL